MRLMRGGAAVAAALLAMVAALPAQAQSWPQRPVKFIVPFGPGAGADIGARLLSDRLAVRWRKPVVVENRPGGDGLVAIQAFLPADDGHTLLFTPSGNFTVHPYQYDKLPYTPADLVPIAQMSNTVIALGVPAAMAVGTLRQWVARSRVTAGQFNAAVVAGITEFVFDYFIKTAGVTVTKVPDRDIAQAATDLGEGRLPVYMASAAILQPQADAGRIKTLVTTGRERASILPQIPTGVESGYPALEVEGLVGTFAPKGMANKLRSKIGADLVEAAKDATISARPNATAHLVNPAGPQEFAASIERQRAQIAKVAGELAIQPKVR